MPRVLRRSALIGAGRPTGSAGLPAEVGVQARYERLRVTHATNVAQLSIKSIGFIDKTVTARAEGGRAHGPDVPGND